MIDDLTQLPTPPFTHTPFQILASDAAQDNYHKTSTSPSSSIIIADATAAAILFTSSTLTAKTAVTHALKSIIKTPALTTSSISTRRSRSALSDVSGVTMTPSDDLKKSLDDDLNESMGDESSASLKSACEEGIDASIDDDEKGIARRLSPAAKKAAKKRAKDAKAAAIPQAKKPKEMPNVEPLMVNSTKISEILGLSMPMITDTFNAASSLPKMLRNVFESNGWICCEAIYKALCILGRLSKRIHGDFAPPMFADPFFATR